ncbi:MAG: hypothetical protein GXC78_14910 [Chitinophagaceae bacterium]|nr:hypothetical protein [Chitinophagaceae bacterium]
MIIQLKATGLLLILLGIFHAFFPGYFEWKKELKPLSLINRQMMYVHTFFIGVTVALMGLLCLLVPNELLETKLGKYIAAGLCLFWLLRCLIQFFYYSSSLWRGRRFETIIHIFFSLLWIYLSTLFARVAIA